MTATLNVTLTADTSRFVAAMKSVALATPLVHWSWQRITLTPGERHIDRIMRDCTARRLDVATTSLRLLVAADLADVLDGEVAA